MIFHQYVCFLPLSLSFVFSLCLFPLSFPLVLSFCFYIIHTLTHIHMASSGSVPNTPALSPPPLPVCFDILTCSDSNEFGVTLSLPAGCYEFKFVVDGEWRVSEKQVFGVYRLMLTGLMQKQMAATLQ